MTIKRVFSLQNGVLHRNFITDHMQQYPFIFSDEKKYRIRRHLAFWIFWWVFQGFLYSFIAVNRNEEYWPRLASSMIESLVFLTAHIFLSYSLMYYVVPRYLLKQKYRITTVLVLALFIITGFISAFLSLTIIDTIRHCIMGGELFTGPRPITTVRIFLALMAGLRGAITIGGIAVAIKLMKYWYMKEQRNLQLQKENVAAQLQLLKAQIHPHFLFNTLNNIYSYTQNTSPLAAKMVSGLSDLLRFMLYEGRQPLVPLAKELKMIQDYINLEKIRYGNKLEISIDLPDHTNDLYIAPLLLLPLVENCFKHGTSNMLEQPWINLQLDIQDKQLRMKLINGKAQDSEDHSVHTGIGIKNVQERLKLLYPDKYELTITNDEEIFIVNLKVELDQRKELRNKPTTTTQLIHD